MAKRIFVADEQIEEFLRSSQAQLIAESKKLKKAKFQRQSDSITLNFLLKTITDDRKASIVFSEQAWTKIVALVQTYTTEIQWHGIVERIAENSFRINDILVFPHKVTGTTVESDPVEYAKWLNELDDDTFNALRFHGHSHVNMGVTPSDTDMTYRRDMLNNFGTPSEDTDYFYIFLIFNKRYEFSGEIYDLQHNALYSTDEIEISVDEGGDWLQQFLEDAKKMVKTYSYSSTNFGGYSGNGTTFGYGGNQAPVVQPASKPTLTPSPSPRRGAKVTDNQRSIFDDDGPDPLDDEYYLDVPGCKGYGGIR